MKILKRNQLIILVMSLMLITAGYLNFNANNNQTVATSTISRDDTTLGDAALVSSVAIQETSTNQIEENNITESQILETQETVAKEVEEDYYFINSKLERESMYSQLLETYQQMFNNSEITAEQKKEASNEITKINNTKNAIMIAENLIKAKGFEDVVIFSNDGSISVIIKIEELLPEQIAQIQNIVSRELNSEIDKIHISTK